VRVLKHEDNTVPAQKHLGRITVLHNSKSQRMPAGPKTWLCADRQVLRHYQIANKAGGKKRRESYAEKPCR
jgi:hypothetical protein